MNYSTVEVIKLESLEDLDKYYHKFENYCSEFQEIKGNGFSYDIDVDYDEMELTININFDWEEDDNTEGDPGLN